MITLSNINKMIYEKKNFEFPVFWIYDFEVKEGVLRIK